MAVNLIINVLYCLYDVFRDGGPWSQITNSWHFFCIYGKHLQRWLPQMQGKRQVFVTWDHGPPVKGEKSIKCCIVNGKSAPNSLYKINSIIWNGWQKISNDCSPPERHHIYWYCPWKTTNTMYFTLWIGNFDKTVLSLYSEIRGFNKN